MKAVAVKTSSTNTLVESGAARLTTEAIAESIKEQLGEDWLAQTYQNKVLMTRTRAHFLQLSGKQNTLIEVQHTLLGIELKVGRQRMMCPDLATARYLAVFARIGCQNVAVPYDITKTSHFADLLEAAWQRMLLLIERYTAGRSSVFRSRLRLLLVSSLRREVEGAGPGPRIPQFLQSTKQRSP